MSVSIKELRYSTKQVLQSLKQGQKPIITYRGKPVAQIIPLSIKQKKNFQDIGFGMWKDHQELEDVDSWLRQKREPRFRR